MAEKNLVMRYIEFAYEHIPFKTCDKGAIATYQKKQYGNCCFFVAVAYSLNLLNKTISPEQLMLLAKYCDVGEMVDYFLLDHMSCIINMLLELNTKFGTTFALVIWRAHDSTIDRNTCVAPLLLGSRNAVHLIHIMWVDEHFVTLINSPIDKNCLWEMFDKIVVRDFNDFCDNILTNALKVCKTSVITHSGSDMRMHKHWLQQQQSKYDELTRSQRTIIAFICDSNRKIKVQEKELQHWKDELMKQQLAQKCLFNDYELALTVARDQHTGQTANDAVIAAQLQEELHRQRRPQRADHEAQDAVLAAELQAYEYGKNME